MTRKASNSMTFSDERLVKKAKSGNNRAFSKLVELHQAKILYLAYDLVGDYEEAKDVAQETFIRAFQKLAQFKEKSKFSTWLYRIAVNLSMDNLRRKQKYPHQSLEDNFDVINNMEITIINDQSDLKTETEVAELRQQLKTALLTLSKNQRTATVLRYFHQKSLPEIAEIMNCAVSTARVHLFRAMVNLKKKLKNTAFEYTG